MRQKSAAKPEYKFGQKVLLLQHLQRGAIDCRARDVNSAANRKASSGSSEKALIILLSSWLLIVGYFWEPRINWAPERPAYYLPIESYFRCSGIQSSNLISTSRCAKERWFTKKKRQNISESSEFEGCKLLTFHCNVEHLPRESPHLDRRGGNSGVGRRLRCGSGVTSLRHHGCGCLR